MGESYVLEKPRDTEHVDKTVVIRASRPYHFATLRFKTPSLAARSTPTLLVASEWCECANGLNASTKAKEAITR